MKPPLYYVLQLSTSLTVSHFHLFLVIRIESMELLLIVYIIYLNVSF